MVAIETFLLCKTVYCINSGPVKLPSLQFKIVLIGFEPFINRHGIMGGIDPEQAFTA